MPKGMFCGEREPPNGERTSKLACCVRSECRRSAKLTSSGTRNGKLACLSRVAQMSAKRTSSGTRNGKLACLSRVAQMSAKRTSNGVSAMQACLQLPSGVQMSGML